MQQLARAQTTVTSCLEDNDFGNKQAPIGDDDIASSITLTGQAVVKQAREIAKKYISEQSGITDDRVLNTVNVAGDTDSYAADTIIKTNYGAFRADELHLKFADTTPTIDQYGHEIYPVLHHSILVDTFCSSKQHVVVGRVKNLMRHRVSKRKFIIKAGKHSIAMTEDHGCMVYRQGKLIRVKPTEIIAGDKMVIKVE